MAVNHALIGNVVGAALKHLRMQEAKVIQARDDSSANYSTRLYADVLSDSDNYQADMKAQVKTYLQSVEEGRAEEDFDAARAMLEQDASLYAILDSELATSETDKSAGLIKPVYSSVNGAITLKTLSGRFGALYNQMVTDAKTVLQCTVTVTGAFAGASANAGTLASAGPVFRDHAMSGTLIFEVQDESVSAPLLRLTEDLQTGGLPLPFAPGSTRGDGGRSTKTLLVADNFLTVDKAYTDWPLASTLTITRPGLTAPTESGDAGNILSSYVVTTPNDADCDKGIFYFKITRQSADPIWLIELWKTSSYATLVGTTTTAAGAGNIALTINCTGGTTVAFNFERTNAAATMAAPGNSQSSSIDIKTPRLGDRWTMKISNDDASYFQRMLKKWGRVSLPSGGGASAEYAEAKATWVAVT